MTAAQGVHTVLIVDDDVAFVWWLGEIFTEAGYQAIPALNPADAYSLLDQISVRLAVIVANAALAGVPALIQSLRSSHEDLRVVLIEDERSSKVPDVQFDATLRRPSGWEPVLKEDWLRKLRALLKQFETAPHR